MNISRIFSLATIAALMFLMAAGIATEQPNTVASLVTNSYAIIGAFSGLFLGIYIIGVCVIWFLKMVSTGKSIRSLTQYGTWKAPITPSIYISAITTLGFLYGNTNLLLWYPQSDSSQTIHIISVIISTIGYNMMILFIFEIAKFMMNIVRKFNDDSTIDFQWKFENDR